MSNWWAVCKIKARGLVEVAASSTTLLSNARAFKEDGIEEHQIDVHATEDPRSLVDSSCSFVEIDDVELEENDEAEHIVESDEEYEVLNDDDDDNVMVEP